MTDIPPADATEPLNIVILGASFAGLAVAHKFLRTTIEEIGVVRQSHVYRVILVGPSTHLYWNIGAPRALTSEKALAIDKVFVPFLELFDEYSRKRFSFVHGLAVDVDFAARNVTVQLSGLRGTSNVGVSTPSRRSKGIGSTGLASTKRPGVETPKNLKKIPFHALVIATGTSALSDLLSLHGDHRDTVQALQRFRTRAARADGIIVAGGGPSGIECAGQLATFLNRGKKPSYKPEQPVNSSLGTPLKRDVQRSSLWSLLFRQPRGGDEEQQVEEGEKTRPITLISRHDRLLPRLPPAFGAQAEAKLQRLGVQILHNTEFKRAYETGSGKTNCIVNYLDRGDETEEILQCGAFVAATGVRPNTGFLPDYLLDRSNYVNADPMFLRIPGAGDRVYAVGDCASHSKNSIQDVYDSVPVLLQNLKNDLITWEVQQQYPRGGAESRLEYLEDWAYVQTPTDSQLMPISRFGGVGILFGMKLPSLLVWLMKGRDYRIGRARLAAGVGKNPYVVV